MIATIRRSSTLCVLFGCMSVQPAIAATDAGFALTATAQDLPQYFPGYLANGYVSTLTAPRGTEGTAAFMVALMDYAEGDMSRPAAIPGWTGIDYSTGPSATGIAWLNKAPLIAARFEDYRQTLDLHGATLSTRYRYHEGAKATGIEVTTLVSQASPHVAATRLSITPDFDGLVQLSFTLDLWAEHEPRLPLARLDGPEMEEAVAAHGLGLQPIAPATPDRAAVWYPGYAQVLAADGDTQALTLWLDGEAKQGLRMAEAAAISLPAGLVPEKIALYRSAYRLALNLSVRVEKGRTYEFTKFVAFSRAGWGGDAREDLALASAARATGFGQLLAAHRAAWSELWQSDVLIEGDEQAQRVLHSELYYLLASSTPGTSWPLGACGMTPGYAGHAFWDSDTWIFPALLLLHPERARSLVDFRSRTLPAAEARARAAGFSGAKYPWESDPENGTEQTPHFAGLLGQQEIHVNADIALAQWQYYLATGDRAWLRERGWPVIRAVAEFWTSRSTYNSSAKRYEILHVASVNEAYSDVPNDAFTNVAAAKTMQVAARAAKLVGEHADPLWERIGAQMYIPLAKDGTRHLDFDPSVYIDPGTWGGSTLTLLTYPSLDWPMSERLRNGDYAYAMHSSTSPQVASNSMGYGPTAIAAAVVGNIADASTWFQGNFTGGTLKAPFNVRTETADNNTGYFLTAAGGYVQSLVYGFSGLRLQEQGLVAAYPPILPTTWQSLTLRNISVRGERVDIRIARDASGRVRLTRQAHQP